MEINGDRLELYLVVAENLFTMCFSVTLSKSFREIVPNTVRKLSTKESPETPPEKLIDTLSL